MKPNVLVLVGSFQQGGSERQAVQLTRLLHESGRYRMHIASLDGRGALRGEVERLGLGDIPEFRLHSFYDFNAIGQISRFAHYLRKHKIDIVQTYDFYTNVFGMAAATVARVSVRIAACRETDGLRTKAQKWTERRAFSLAHGIVVNSNAVRQQLTNDGVRAERIVTIYNGMDTQRIALPPDLRRADILAALKLSADDRRRYVTIVANMHHPMKDQATFLRAGQRVLQVVPEAAFVLAGDGRLRDSLQALAAQLGMERDVFFLGSCTRVSELLGVSEVCVLCSKGVEGFSNSLIEYMAAAHPVVATNIGGAREAVVEGETGYLIEPGDDATLASRIISLLRDPERARRMGEQGLRVVKEHFSCEAQLERVETLYERLLTGNGVLFTKAVRGDGYSG
jgi:L-malate glycosyltransferase